MVGDLNEELDFKPEYVDVRADFNDWPLMGAALPHYSCVSLGMTLALLRASASFLFILIKKNGTEGQFLCISSWLSGHLGSCQEGYSEATSRLSRNMHWIG